MTFPVSRRILTVSVVLLAALLGGAGSALLGVCGPFTDVSDAAFCPFVLEVFTLGITTGTTPTTYDPASPVSRLQMAAFLSRTTDAVLKRGSRRAALNKFWPSEANASLSVTTVGTSPLLLAADGDDIWVANNVSGTVSRVHASNGALTETWTGAGNAFGVLSAIGKVFVTGAAVPGRLYRIDPSQTAGAVTTVASDLGNLPYSISYDGSRIWTANNTPGSVSIVTPGATTPWTVTTVATGFGALNGIVFDGVNIWVTDQAPGLKSDSTAAPGTLVRLDSAGAILQSVTVGASPLYAVYDGTNIWVPNAGEANLSVVRASNGAVLATLTGNGLGQPLAASFDGQRVLVTNVTGLNVSLWKAADLSPLGNFAVGATPYAACSDGINFWITEAALGQLVRF